MYSNLTRNALPNPIKTIRKMFVYYLPIVKKERKVSWENFFMGIKIEHTVESSIGSSGTLVKQRCSCYLLLTIAPPPLLELYSYCTENPERHPPGLCVCIKIKGTFRVRKSRNSKQEPRPLRRSTYSKDAKEKRRTGEPSQGTEGRFYLLPLLSFIIHGANGWLVLINSGVLLTRPTMYYSIKMPSRRGKRNIPGTLIWIFFRLGIHTNFFFWSPRERNWIWKFLRARVQIRYKKFSNRRFSKNGSDTNENYIEKSFRYEGHFSNWKTDTCRWILYDFSII